MDPRIRREALRTAAKLAFGTLSSVAVIACGGKTYFSPDLPATTEDRTANEDRTAPAGGAPDASCTYPPAVVLSPGFEQTATFTRAELECCSAHVEASVQGGGKAADDPQWDTCCNAIIAGVDVQMIVFADVSSGARMACCFPPNGQRESLWNHSLCSPWGPPVPPEMDWSIEGVA